jgi:hypothetical protein
MSILDLDVVVGVMVFVLLPLFVLFSLLLWIANLTAYII